MPRRRSIVVAALTLTIPSVTHGFATAPRRLTVQPKLLRRHAARCCEVPGETGVADPPQQLQQPSEFVGKVAPVKEPPLPSLALPRLEKLSLSFDTSGYVVLGLCCAIATISSLDRVMMSVAILPMSAELLYSDTTKGLIAAAFTTGYFLFFVPAGVVAATFSPSATLSVGLVIWSLAQAATPTAAYLGLAPLLACRAVMGVGESCTFPSIQAIAARWVPEQYRSRFWGLLTACFNLGTLAAYTASPALIESYGWPASFVVFGAVGLALTALWAAVGRDAPATPDLCVPEECPVDDDDEQEDCREIEGVVSTAAMTTTTVLQQPASSEDGGGDGDGAAAATALERARALPWGEIASSPAVWGMTSASIASNYFLYFAIAWLPTYFSYQFNLDTGAASAASAAPFAAAAVGCVAAGASADALVARGVALTTVRKAATLVSTLGPMGALLLLASQSGSLGYDGCQAVFVGALALHAFNTAGYGVGVQDISRKSASLISGVTAGIGVMTGAASQYITGSLLDSNGRDFVPVFLICAAVQLFGAVGFTAWWDSERLFE